MAEHERPKGNTVDRLITPNNPRTVRTWKLITALAKNHPNAFRQLWLSAVYFNYRQGIIWGDAREEVQSTIMCSKK